MNYLNKLIGFKEAEATIDDSGDAVESAPAPKHGPGRFRYMTAGQIRRAIARSEAAQRRKANRRYRREWMKQQQLLANLRGQLLMVGALPSAVTGFPYPKGDWRRVKAEAALIAKYGSVDEAKAVFLKAVAAK